MSYLASVLKDIEKLNYTNLYLAEILIEDYLQNHNNYNGISRNEISKKWNTQRENGRYKKQYYESYCQRKAAHGDALLTFNTTTLCYKINDNNGNFESLHDGELLRKVKERIDSPNPIFLQIEYFERVNNKEEFFTRIKDFLQSGTANDFEVMSFSILALFFELYGFDLKRFTSTNANDGGVDFIGGHIIYCVTTNLNLKKLENDINKTHAKKIFIYRNQLGNSLAQSISSFVMEGKISDILNVNDIIDFHLKYLERKDDCYQVVDRLKGIIIKEYLKEIT